MDRYSKPARRSLIRRRKGEPRKETKRLAKGKAWERTLNGKKKKGQNIPSQAKKKWGCATTPV